MREDAKKKVPSSGWRAYLKTGNVSFTIKNTRGELQVDVCVCALKISQKSRHVQSFHLSISHSGNIWVHTHTHTRRRRRGIRSTLSTLSGKTCFHWIHRLSLSLKNLFMHYYWTFSSRTHSNMLNREILMYICLLQFWSLALTQCHKKIWIILLWSIYYKEEF